MAQQLGAIQFRGKVGNVVGRRKSASQRANTLAMRPTSVKNPRTLAQRKQRMKLTPAVNFYRQLAGILDHSFQGVTYGGSSHNYFMKQAMLKDSGFPYVTKGTTLPVPGEYLISRGSLPQFPFTATNVSGRVSIEVYGWDLNGGGNATIGEVSNYLLESNAGLLSEGDQLTFITIAANDGIAWNQTEASIIYHVARFVVDTQSETPISDWAASQGVSITSDLYFPSFIGDQESFASSDWYIIGFDIITSRPPLRQGGAWQRSTTYMWVSDAIKEGFMSPTALSAAMESYGIDESEVTSDWYLNQGNGSGTTASGGGTGVQRTLSNAQVTINGASRNVMVMTQGETQYLVVSDIQDGRRYTYEYNSSSNTAEYSAQTQFTTAQIEAAGMQVRLISTVQSYFPGLSVQAGAITDNP